ncbi:MAG: alpha/beta hydrolase [Rudaea sp.]|uniref:alpha/beta fold hydrolase n=1 Tax=unclassified Rudaea TaxID=2627037 RepID=UPI0010F85F95|nr:MULTISPECIES: alpha/beta hydrolase [unclassified Rudaea]MBN8888363.1 alpha/beta hydrolase [Rudaea sp.]
MVTTAATLPTSPAPVPQRATKLTARDGVELAIEHFGDERDPAIVFAHGFGQTRRAWDGTASTLARYGWHGVTADARGHGDSSRRTHGDYDYEQYIDDLVRLARYAGEGATHAASPVLVGASMGGLIGLAAEALNAPLFRALVLVDITPRWEPAGVERILTFMRAHPDGFASYDEAADEIARYLPHRTERKSEASLRQLLVKGEDGRLRWHWDSRMLDFVTRDTERLQHDLLIAASGIRVPILLISGGRSDIVSAKTIDEFLSHVPHAQHVRVDQATHMVAGDANDAFAQAVLDFLDTLRDEGTADARA